MGWAAEPGWASAHAGALARTFAALAGDIVLVLDEGGTILAAAQGEVPAGQGWVHGWVGRSWPDTASEGTRSKLQQMLRDLGQAGTASKREVNHPADDGHVLAVAWTAIRLDSEGTALAVGRDLAAALQQQQELLRVQQQLEASYWQLRNGGN